MSATAANGSNSNESAQRSATAPSPRIKPTVLAGNKRIVVCCDGTWQDGIVVKKRWQYSNILKLSRTLDHHDTRHSPPIHQVVFYQTGIGSSKNFYSEWVEGATGASLAEKVQEAYAFIAHNYRTGDEIYLFGFSRGAYTARMTAAIIGEIGVLDKKDMDHFADIFIAYQKRGKTNDENEKAQCNKILDPFTNPNAKGRLRADADGDTFTIKCVGVFDTVGSLGLPEELTWSKKAKQLFGFPDKFLGAHIQHAFHAMALHETRADFDVAKFEQTDEGRAKGQVLKQVWFAGSHSDIGGGWQSHDLSDLTLAWMVSNIEQMLSVDIDYLCALPRPVAPWGKQVPHNPQTGIFMLSSSIQRILPDKTDEKTHETFHPSVTHQSPQLPALENHLKKNSSLLGTLTPLEEQIKAEWPYVPGKYGPHGKEGQDELDSQKQEEKILVNLQKGKTEGDGSKPHYEESWLGAIFRELTT